MSQFGVKWLKLFPCNVPRILANITFPMKINFPVKVKFPGNEEFRNSLVHLEAKIICFSSGIISLPSVASWESD